MEFKTRQGVVTVSTSNNELTDLIKIEFENSDAVLCVYVDELTSGYSVAYMPYPDADRYPEDIKDIRFKVEKKGGVVDVR